MNCFGRIKDEIDLKRLRLKDIFETFDVHGTKKITRDQFIRCLGMNKVEVTPEEEEQLFKAYSTDDGYIAYYLFVKDMEQVIPSEQITSTKTFGETMSRKLLPPGAVESKSDEETQKLHQALAFLKNRTKTHGLIVKNFFFDYDRIKTGYVTEMQFRRGMKEMVKEFPEELVDVLVERYGYQTSSRVKDVNYDALQKDIDKYGNKDLPDFPWTQKLYHEPIDNSYTDDELQELFWKKVEELRIRPKDYFQVFDKLNTGFVTMGEFLRALNMCRIDTLMSPELLQRLADLYYKPECNKINYLELDGNVKSKTFVRSFTNYKPPLEHGLDRTSVLKPHQYEAVDSVLDELKEKISKNRMNYNIKDLFIDFDRVHEEHITPAQFDRVLKRFDLLPNNEEDLELIHQKFHASGGDHPRINYKWFLQCVDPTPNIKEPEFKTNRLPPEPVYVPDGILEIMKKCRAITAQNRIRLNEFFRDYDKLRSGKVTAHQFEIGLDIAGLKPTAKEIQDLVFTYAAPQKEDFSQIYICYPNFIKDIDSVFMGDDPYKDLDPNSLNNTTGFHTLQYSTNRLDNNEKNELENILDKLRHFSSSRRVLMTPDFEHFDWHHSGYITKPQFQRVCKTLGLLSCISEDELEVICKAFAMPHRDSRDDVNYTWFVKSLETLQLPKVLTSIPSVYETFKPPFDEPGEVPTRPIPKHTDYGPVFRTMEETLLLNKLRYQVKTRGIRIKGLIEDYIPLRQDHIPKAKLRTVLTNAGFVLMEDEWSILERCFQHPTVEEGIEWRVLVEELNSPPVIENPERKVDLYGDAMKIMKHTMMSQTINAKPTFQHFDRQNIGRITTTQFHRAMDIVGLTQKLTPEQAEAVVQKYVTPERDTRNMADYVTFIKDVENYYNL